MRFLCILQSTLLVLANRGKYFENAQQCNKPMRKQVAATSLQAFVTLAIFASCILISFKLKKTYLQSHWIENAELHLHTGGKNKMSL